MKNWDDPLDPYGYKDYVFGWDTLLANESNDTIVSYIITPSDAAIALGFEFDTDSTINTGTNVQAWFKINATYVDDEAYEGQGQVFDIMCSIVTAAGRKFEKTVELRVRQL